LTVDGREFVVPKEQFDDLRDPRIKTAHFRCEAGLGGGPWLYLTFQLANLQTKKRNLHQIGKESTFRYQSGKLMERSIRQPQK
jgi:hypothetical protein